MKPKQNLLHQFVAYNANRHLQLYRRTGDGLLVWRAYLEYRKHGLPVPDEILKLLDRFAAKLQTAKSASQVATAMGMKTRGGGRAGSSRTTATERRRDKVEFVRACLLLGMTEAEARQRAAAEFKTTPAAIKSLLHDWRSSR